MLNLILFDMVVVVVGGGGREGGADSAHLQVVFFINSLNFNTFKTKEVTQYTCHMSISFEMAVIMAEIVGGRICKSYVIFLVSPYYFIINKYL